MASWEGQFNGCMPWGKYKGHLISEIPQDYLRWAIKNADSMSISLRERIEGVLGLAPGSTGPSRIRELEEENEILHSAISANKDQLRRILRYCYGEMSPPISS